MQLLAEERKKNRLLRETLDTKERTIVELQARISELMKVSVTVPAFYLLMAKSYCRILYIAFSVFIYNFSL